MSQTPRAGVLQDWTANRGRPGIQVVLALFRTAQLARGAGGGLRRLASAPVLLLYRIVALRLFAIDLPGPPGGARGRPTPRGRGLVVTRAPGIGASVPPRHNTPLGARRTDDDCPVLGSGVDVGPNSVLLGPIEIGAD